MGGAAVGGEIVEVQGGHIVRSTGRKDRHSKVCTAKGPRDRRVRLAAHTAIQFYDVQDRLGYDRPSKAVDWLIKKAKAAIDELVELPAWHPMDAAATSPALNAGFGPENVSKKFERQNQPHNMLIPDATGFSGKRVLTMLGSGNEHMSGFLSPSLDSDVIADTVKSFFPMGDTGGAGESSSSALQFQSFSTNDLFSRNSINNSQDLRLSLQSFQDSNFLHHHTPPPQAHSNPSPHHHYEHETQSQGQQHVFLTSIPLGFDGLHPLPEQHHPSPELVRLRQLPSFTSGGCGDGFSFGSPRLLSSSLSGHNNQFLTSTQRGPLQSSNTPSLRAWMDHPPAGMAISITDHHYHHPGAYPMRPTSSFSGGIGFSGYGGFSGFNIPARIQGDEEPDDGYSEKPSSASSDSRH